MAESKTRDNQKAKAADKVCESTILCDFTLFYREAKDYPIFKAAYKVSTT